MNTTKRFTIIVLLVHSFTLISQIKLPKLISDGMVLQRNEAITVWGWAASNEIISLDFKDKTYATKADNQGNWQFLLPAQKAGGPYEMVFKGRNKIKVQDILFGDVWLCSGQSNMELPMERVKEKYGEAIKNSENSNIRHFLIPDTYNFKGPQTTISSGAWMKATPENTLNFSAVAYFFAKKVNEKQGVPIGLINSALGGSPIEAWLSEETLVQFPYAYNELQKYKDDVFIKDIQNRDKKRSDDWYTLLNSKDEGLLDNKWSNTNIDDSNWKTMEIPGFWANTSMGNTNGVVWFRKEITVPESLINKPVKLFMGRIVDQDFVYVNGELVGTTGYQYPPRRYKIKPGILKPGKNTIAIRVINNSGKGGFIFDKPYYMAAGKDSVDLKGQWKYKLGTTMSPLKGPTFIRWKPGGLYNAMIAPLTTFKLKGILWYQGESNTRNPDRYKQTLPALINDWRSKWNQGKLPFLYVQLPNFMKTHPEPRESNWAAFRQAQLETLSVSNTGMAVAIDLGEWNDIHPLNKQSVANRLALLARKLVYGEKQIQAASPMPNKSKFKTDKVIISFKNTGNGLITKNGNVLKGFAISNDNKNFVWANATIENNTVIVWHTNVTNPTSVRYAWDNNPADANLYNNSGLPSTPFEVKKQ